MSITQIVFFIFFFFQAEDGIRDLTVTGVQTCALPISGKEQPRSNRHAGGSHIEQSPSLRTTLAARDRKSTRLNSSHSQISYAVFCLKKKKQGEQITDTIDSHDMTVYDRPTLERITTLA